MVIGASAAALYIVDAHRDIAIEAFTCLLMFKNFFSYALTYPAYDWLRVLGRPKMFTILGSAQVFVCLLTVPMYIFGKRNRSFWKRHDMYKILRLDTRTKSEEEKTLAAKEEQRMREHREGHNGAAAAEDGRMRPLELRESGMLPFHMSTTPVQGGDPNGRV